MFQTLFRYPKVRARHEHSPLATERRAYLSHRADLGSPKSTLRKWANELLVVCRELRLSAPRTVSPSQIRHAAQRWAKRQRRRGRARTCLWAQTLFVQTATAWLKFTGRLRERPIRTEASQPWLDRLRHHLRYQRRLRPGHDPTASVLINRRGGRVTRSQAETTFRRLRGRLQIQRPGGTRQQPRLHDLRQNAACREMPSGPTISLKSLGNFSVLSFSTRHFPGVLS